MFNNNNNKETTMQNQTINKIPNFELKNTDGVRKFIKWLYKNNINFHPDDDFNEYTFENEERCFSFKVGNAINYNFELIQKIYTDSYMYKIIFDEMKIYEKKRNGANNA